MELCPHSPIRLHDVGLNSKYQGQVYFQLYSSVTPVICRLCCIGKGEITCEKRMANQGYRARTAKLYISRKSNLCRSGSFKTSKRLHHTDFEQIAYSDVNAILLPTFKTFIWHHPLHDKQFPGCVWRHVGSRIRATFTGFSNLIFTLL
jgi:hypothetical protein